MSVTLHAMSQLYRLLMKWSADIECSWKNIQLALFMAPCEVTRPESVLGRGERGIHFIALGRPPSAQSSALSGSATDLPRDHLSLGPQSVDIGAIVNCGHDRGRRHM